MSKIFKCYIRNIKCNPRKIIKYNFHFHFYVRESYYKKIFCVKNLSIKSEYLKTLYEDL